MLTKSHNIVFRKIHGTAFLIDISDNYAGDSCALYELNETGAFLWDCLDHIGTVEGLAKALQNAIVDEVEYDIIFNDVNEYIHVLAGKQFLKEV